MTLRELLVGHLYSPGTLLSAPEEALSHSRTSGGCIEAFNSHRNVTIAWRLPDDVCRHDDEERQEHSTQAWEQDQVQAELHSKA